MATTQFTKLAVVDATPRGSAAYGGESVPILDHINTTPVTGDILILARIPVDSKIASLQIINDDLGTAAPADIGFYRTKDDGAAVVDIDAIAGAIAMGTATTTWTEQRFEIAASAAEAAFPAWQVAGLSERPSYGSFDLAITWGTVNTGNSGDIAFLMHIIQ